MLACAVPCCRRRRGEHAPPPLRVVVLGGGFGGLYVARELGDDPRFEIFLVEPKSFAEYVPGVARALVYPEHAPALQADMASAVPAAVSVVRAIATHILDCGCAAADAPPDAAPAPPVVGLLLPNGARTLLPYDALVIATGSSYRAPYKAGPGVDGVTASADADSRCRELARAHGDLAAAASLVVVGGGAVGVELAAEILHRWPSKRLTLVHAPPALLPGMAPAISTAAAAWLRGRGAQLLLGHRVISEREEEAASAAGDAAVAGGGGGGAGDLRGGCRAAAGGGAAARLTTLTTDGGAVIRCDAVLHCLGISPNTAFLEDESSSPCFHAALLPRAASAAAAAAASASAASPPTRRVSVDACLRLSATAASSKSRRAGEPPSPALRSLVFALGDIASLSSCAEPALAHTAEKHAEVIVRSLRRVASALAAEAERAAAAAVQRLWSPPSPFASSASTAAAAARGEPAFLAAARLGGAACLPYPRALTGCASAPVIMDVSLGPWSALLQLDGLALHDAWVGARIGALAKHFIEVSKVWQMRNGAVGRAIWHFGDEAALLLHAYITRWTL